MLVGALHLGDSRLVVCLKFELKRVLSLLGICRQLLDLCLVLKSKCLFVRLYCPDSLKEFILLELVLPQITCEPRSRIIPFPFAVS